GIEAYAIPPSPSAGGATRPSPGRCPRQVALRRCVAAAAVHPQGPASAAPNLRGASTTVNGSSVGHRVARIHRDDVVAGARADGLPGDAVRGVDGVDSAVALEDVEAGSAGDRVVSVAADQDVVTRPAVDDRVAVVGDSGAHAGELEDVVA